MSQQNDFKKDWEAAKKQILKFSQEAARLTKRGEEELVKFSRVSKLHIDSTTLGIKKEKLYYLIGKEYVSCKDPEKSSKLKKMVEEIENLEKGQKAIRLKLKTKAPEKKTVQKTTKKTVKTAVDKEASA